MKLLTVRVTVATDDDLDIKTLKTMLQAIIAERGTQPSCGDECGPGPRVHWGTVDVLQGPERVAARRGKGKAQPGLLAP